jgi:DNA-binding MarR family transcriptional regulator
MQISDYSQRSVDEDLLALRRFNRSYTQRIGALDESFLGSGRPLGPSRVLFEIGPDGIGLLQLRRRLGLDSGYVSRLLRQLESEGLVTVSADPTDGRRRVLRLTKRGSRAWRDLDRSSDALARRLLEPLSPRQRSELTHLLSRADRLVRMATVCFEVVDPSSAEARAAMTEYFSELDRRFPGGFDPGDTLVVDAPSMRAPEGAFVLARSDDEVVACGGVKAIDASTAEIKRMWVHPGFRGTGLGRRMLERLEQAARGLGRGRVVLDTNPTLIEAITMYERAGYRSIERYNDNPYAGRWFAKSLI